ncbi:MAG TPA: hypothetical protein PKD45_07450 [Flavobacteriales bacterium]|nr:hypothetical protein [Flavobacteriales bacterium]
MKRHSFSLIPLLLTLACNSSIEAKKFNSSESSPTDSSVVVQHSFYPKGQLRAEVGTIAGLQHGVLKEYFEDGSIKAIQDWQHGQPIGEFKIYDEHGATIYHAKSEYKEYPEGTFLVHSTLVYDSTKTFSTDNRIVVADAESLNEKLIVRPREIRFGDTTEIQIEIPNMEIYQARITNGTIIKGRGPNTYVVQPNSANGNVMLYVVSRVNGKAIDFDPIELIVK